MRNLILLVMVLSSNTIQAQEITSPEEYCASKNEMVEIIIANRSAPLHTMFKLLKNDTESMRVFNEARKARTLVDLKIIVLKEKIKCKRFVLGLPDPKIAARKLKNDKIIGK